MTRRLPDVEVPDEIAVELADEPWLRPYVEIGDSDLQPARRRFELDQAVAQRALVRAGVTLQTRFKRGALETTAYDKGELRPEHTP